MHKYMIEFMEEWLKQYKFKNMIRNSVCSWNTLYFYSKKQVKGKWSRCGGITSKEVVQ
jgi:hypothetical protein